MVRRLRRLVIATFLLLVAHPALTRAAPQSAVADHYWIVLLDVSSSFSDVQTKQHRDRFGPHYDIRNEGLSILQALLAVAGEDEPGVRRDFLTVLVFGSAVQRITELTTGAIVWDEIHKESWWRGQLAKAQALSTRTELFQAIEQAVKQFEVYDDKKSKHLILISDGELDVGPTNRDPGTAPGSEELRAYRSQLADDPLLVRKLREEGVRVHTLAVDRTFAGADDTQRQQQIRKTLWRYGDQPLVRFLSLVDDAARCAIGPNGGCSEGPYFMQALADTTGGASRSIHASNLLDVLWEIIVPQGIPRRFIPPGTRKVVIFAPIDASVPLDIGEGREPIHVTLAYDKKRDSPRIDPATSRIRARVHPTTQYATWLVESDLPIQSAGGTRVVPINNLQLQWEPDAPPRQVARGSDLEIALRLLWRSAPEGPTLEAWREYAREHSVRASASVSAPDGSPPVKVDLQTSVPSGSEPVVLEMRGKFHTEQPGLYRVQAQLEIGSESERWSKELPDTSFLVGEPPTPSPSRPPSPTPPPSATPQPTATPSPTPPLPVIVMRPLTEGTPGTPVQILPRREGEPPPAVVFPRRGPSEFTLERWIPKQEQARPEEQFHVVIPDVEGPKKSFGEEYSLPTPALAEDPNFRKVWEVPGLKLSAEQLGKPLPIQAIAGDRTIATQIFVLQARKTWWDYFVEASQIAGAVFACLTFLYTVRKLREPQSRTTIILISSRLSNSLRSLVRFGPPLSVSFTGPRADGKAQTWRNQGRGSFLVVEVDRQGFEVAFRKWRPAWLFGRLVRRLGRWFRLSSGDERPTVVLEPLGRTRVRLRRISGEWRRALVSQNGEETFDPLIAEFPISMPDLVRGAELRLQHGNQHGTVRYARAEAKSWL